MMQRSECCPVETDMINLTMGLGSNLGAAEPFDAVVIGSGNLFMAIDNEPPFVAFRWR